MDAKYDHIAKGQGSGGGGEADTVLWAEQLRNRKESGWEEDMIQDNEVQVSGGRGVHGKLK